MTEQALSLRWVAEATAGEIASGDPNLVLGEVVTDTRTLQRGDFFVALRGPTHDGHTYLGTAARLGMSGALVERRWCEGTGRAEWAADAGSAGLVIVEDALRGLQDMARALRQQSGTKVVAITGSAGKTTTKETIAAMLATRWRVVKNKGNFNNHIGLPLSLMALRSRPDVAVMELGMNHRGEISALVAIADPDVRVWTNVGDAHLGFFQSADAIADAKAEVLEGADDHDVLVCNADDPLVMARTASFPGRTITFGLSTSASVRATDVVDRGASGMRAHLVTPAGDRQIETRLLGRGNLSNLLAATAVAMHFDVPLDEVVEQIRDAAPAERRGSVRRSPDGVIVIDDSYNSSPAALRKALDVLAHDGGGHRRIAVLGEMLELGGHAERLHRECGTAAAGAGLALLVAVGGRAARAIADGAREAGMPAAAVHYMEGSVAAAAFVAEVVRPGDLVLVKGSRGIRTDVIVDRILGGGA